LAGKNDFGGKKIKNRIKIYVM